MLISTGKLLLNYIRLRDVFEEILSKGFVVTTSGSGFGMAGEGFLRFSGLGKQEELLKRLNV